MMDVNERRIILSSTSKVGGEIISKLEEEMMIRKGPWSMEEDLKLVDYITIHGEGHWNSLAQSAGLKRTGKSCRLRWLNYLRPDVRRGNITPQEQLLILQLHCHLGNRWSKIAEHLPGRTDNEIKNYWRTRVEKQAKQLKFDVNSPQFRDTMRYVWLPRLVERIRAQPTTTTTTTTTTSTIIKEDTSTVTAMSHDVPIRRSTNINIIIPKYEYACQPGTSSTHMIMDDNFPICKPKIFENSLGLLEADIPINVNPISVLTGRYEDNSYK